MSVETDTASRRPDCVVIDTNVWRSQLLLKTPLGMSFVYALGRQKGFLGLPEVIERELTRQIVELGLEQTAKMADPFARLNTLVGPTLPQPAATKEELERLTRARIAELEPILVRIPFTLEHAQAALDMVNAKVPPNGEKNQQFKDSAVWQAILQLPKRYTARLVTEDKGFYADREHSKGLALNLQEDCRRVGCDVDVYPDLGACLVAITTDLPSFDRVRLTSLLEAFITPVLRSEAARLRFEIREVLNADIKAFWTNQPSRLAMDFTVVSRFDAHSTASNYRDADCRVVTYGSCYYDCGSDSISGAFVEEIRFVAKTPSGGRSVNARSFKYDDPSIPIRRPLPWERTDPVGDFEWS